jgi:hypothetical protein
LHLLFLSLVKLLLDTFEVSFRKFTVSNTLRHSGNCIYCQNLTSRSALLPSQSVFICFLYDSQNKQ